PPPPVVDCPRYLSTNGRGSRVPLRARWRPPASPNTAVGAPSSRVYSTVGLRSSRQRAGRRGRCRGVTSGHSGTFGRLPPHGQRLGTQLPHERDALGDGGLEQRLALFCRCLGRVPVDSRAAAGVPPRQVLERPVRPVHPGVGAFGKGVLG